MTDDIRTLLALSQLPRVPRGSLRRLLARLAASGNAITSVLDAIGVLQLPRPLPTALAPALAAADQILERCQQTNIAILRHGSTAYPTPLYRLAYPPTLLFVQGTFAWHHSPRIAVIGTRTPTAWGTRTTGTCVARIVAANGVVVSGLAPGIDTAAHEETVADGGCTWAVLAMGI